MNSCSYISKLKNNDCRPLHDEYHCVFAPFRAVTGMFSNLKGFSQPCNFDGISSNPSQSDMSGNHEITQNNKPIPTRVTCRSENRSKKWHEKTNRDCAFNKYCGQSIIYAYRNRSKGVYLAMANWLNEIKKRIFVPITSEIGSETN
jgi:hypothetical protein